MEQVTAIILAAGKGTRMQSTDTNKVALPVKGEPMLSRTIRILKEAGVSKFVVVVGFARESVMPLLTPDIETASQDEQLGTGHAVSVALSKVKDDTNDVLIVYGDDSFLHTPETFQKLYRTHKENNSKITFISMQSENPTGFGRILRNDNEDIIGIVEEKNATDEQRKISEINLGCYVINLEYLKNNISRINKNPVTGEYYITDIIDIISSQGGKIAAYRLPDTRWQGVNTRQDLEQAENLMQYEN